MKEIKLTIDGKEIQLTDEQLKMLGIEPEKKRKNPFEEPRFSQDYYFTNECGIGKYFYYDNKNDYDYEKLRNGANVFTDKHFTFSLPTPAIITTTYAHVDRLLTH